MSPINLIGQRFGKLLVTGLQPAPRLWRCRCDCGGRSLVTTGRLRSGNTRSCGCEKRKVLGRSTTKHGMAGSNAHNIWKAMRTRCNNKHAPSYKSYGGRGIKICKRWNDFACFYADMGEPPAGTSIERKNNNGNYTASNCAWATRKEQSRNTRRNVTGTHKGKQWCVADLADAHGVARRTAQQRMLRGWSFSAACTVPAHGAIRGSSGKVLRIGKELL